ncbi:MAG TPA: hypothetical protein VGF94_09305 [Kofleriaceae bacterium]
MVKAGAIVACIAAWMACTVDYKTDQLRCATTADCAAPRVCNDGFCTTDCPDDCSDGCDGTTTPPTCTINANGNGNVACPAGWQCQINCNHPNSCSNVDCTAGAGCTISCDGPNTCAVVDCGTASCDVTCNSGNSCGAIDCSSSCACDVHCNSGICGNTCPMQDGMTCVDSGGGGNCSSNASGCDTCP